MKLIYFSRVLLLGYINSISRHALLTDLEVAPCSLENFLKTALERLAFFYTVDKALHWGLELTSLLLGQNQNMFSSGGSPAVRSVLNENLILVAGRVVFQTKIGLYRSVPGSFFFCIRLFLADSALLSAECLVIKRRRSSYSPFFFSLVAVFICVLNFFFCFLRVISRCLLLFLGSFVA